MQVVESDPDDPFGDKVVQLLDDFKITGINGTREFIQMKNDLNN